MAQQGSTPPDDSDRAMASAPPTSAGGLGAIKSTLKLLGKTGAVRGLRALARVNQPGGFDCPGCAWPEPRADHRPALEFCENGAKAVAFEVTPTTIGAEFFTRHSIADLCAWSDHDLGNAGRLAEPLVRRPGRDHYEPLSWTEAIALVAKTLRGLASPDEAAFYTSGRTSNEAAYLYQLFVRAYGTNNLPDCSNLCHESSGVALKETIGVGKGTVQLDDFERADAIFVLGQNPGTNHPRMMTTLEAAAKRGCRIVSINPLAEAALSRFAHPQDGFDLMTGGAPIASLHIPVRIGGDVALLKGVMKEMLEEDERRPGHVLDHAFIATFTEGFVELAADLAACEWTDLEADSGVARAQMKQVAEIAWTSRATIACWAMGLTQHKHAVANIQSVVNLLLLGGHIGRPGAGLCPVRGHSNVQGDRTMGITSQPAPAFLDCLQERHRFAPPRARGLDTVGTIEAMESGAVKVLFALGGNFLSASPDTERTAAALRRCTLTAHVATTLNRAHLITGQTALLLPCLGRSERDTTAAGDQFVTVENSMGIVHRSQGRLPPVAKDALSEPAIVARLAQATLRSHWPWTDWADDLDRVRDEIAAVIPGFSNFNERVRAPDGLTLENAARLRRFETDTGKAHFTVHATADLNVAADQLVLMTIRSHDQYNTTVYGLDDRYRGITGGRRVVFLHPEDLRARGLAAGDFVDLHSHFRGHVRTAPRWKAVAYDLPRGCAAAYFPEANALIPLDSYADKSRTPTSKSVIVTVTRA